LPGTRRPRDRARDHDRDRDPRPGVGGGACRRKGCDIVNRDSTRAVNAAILDADVPLYAVTGPGIVVAGPGVSFLARKGDYAVGVGCRKGVSPADVAAAVGQALHEAGVAPG